MKRTFSAKRAMVGRSIIASGANEPGKEGFLPNLMRATICYPLSRAVNFSGSFAFGVEGVSRRAALSAGALNLNP
jgi:hypothetical protein